MKKNRLKSTILAVSAFAMISSVKPLAVSAETRQAIVNNYNYINCNNTTMKFSSFNDLFNYINKLGLVKSYNMTSGNIVKQLNSINITTGGTGNVAAQKSTTNTSTITTNTNVTTNNTTTATNVQKTTANTSASAATIDTTGLPNLPQTYAITVQSSAENKILELMNQKRIEAGLKPLTMDNTLLKVARYKSDDMIQNNFFSHTNPDGTKWTNWLQALGYEYTTTGENIAYNTTDPVELFNQWWNSPGHKANMMNPSFTKVGIGVIYGNNKYMGTQDFSN